MKTRRPHQCTSILPVVGRLTAAFLALWLIALPLIAGSPESNTDQLSGYYADLSKELQEKHNLPAGRFLFGTNEGEVFKHFNYYGRSSGKGSMEKKKASSDVPFEHYARVDINEPPGNYWGVIFGQKGHHSVKLDRGDLILAVVSLRSEGRANAGKPTASLALKGNGTNHGRHKVFVSPEWKRHYLAFKVKKDLPADSIKTEFFLGYGAQSIDIGGIAFIHYGTAVRKNELPETEFEYSYDGRKENAAWREEARKRIQKHRKSKLNVVVRDEDGDPVSDADVTVSLTEHAFQWGNLAQTSVSSLDNETAKKYREVFQKNFNMLTIGTFKWPAWRGAWSDKHDRDNTLKVLKWANEQDIPVHGHTPIWHEFGVMPYNKNENSKNEIRTGIKEWLRKLLTLEEVNGNVYSWDAINHPYGFNQVWKHVGKDIMLEELKLYKKLDPGSKRFVNEGGVMTLGGGQFSVYKDYVKWLMEKDAPVDGVGFMCHFGARSVTPPEELLDRLDAFAELDSSFENYDLELKITEFDISINRGNPEQVRLQNDYFRDFMIAVFSHPDVRSLHQWGFWAGEAWKPSGMIYNEDWSLRPHGKIYRDLVFDRWWTDVSGSTDRQGRYATNGFLGNYDITVEKGDRKKTVTASLDASGQTVNITLDGRGGN